MRSQRAWSLFLIALIWLSSLSPVIHADEGMWPFNNVPKAEIKRRYGFEVTDAWLRKVQLASVRFNNGGSGSFVSPDGLVLTNHHIASDTLAKLSTPERDLVKQGFYARTRAEELRAPDLELNVLVDIEDVTDRVNAAVKPGMSPAEANAARRAAIAAIEKESLEKTGLRSDVVTLYQGGQYNLYRYKRYTDVRLVFAPEFQIAFFGGDPDNFTYPRYCLDMALFRVYENGQPAHVENYLKWSPAGARDGELVFVSGHPGSTQRLNTVAHLEYLRDFGLPLLIRWLEVTRAALLEYSRKGEEQARRAQEDLFGVENSLKALRGQLEGLKDPKIIARKREAEAALRAFVAADARRQREYGDAWDAIARARASLASYERERRFLEGGWGFNSRLFDIARTLVRLAEENEKPDAERLPEYTTARRESLELQLYSPAPIYDDFEQIKLAASLRFMRDELGAANPVVQKVLAGKTPEERAAELVSGTKLKDVAYRKQLAAGGSRAIEESKDPMIELARAVDAEARAVRKRYEDEVVGVEREAYAKIARALFEKEGTKIYPDATFTLRLSYGAVRGYMENGKFIPPFTFFAGLYERAAQHGNKTPYQLPPRWSERKAALNLRTPFNFVSTNDIIGGNSGSPVINRNAELVGLIFDGNIQSLVGNFVYDDTQNRAIAVDVRGMIEALRKIYGAEELVQELLR
ncbi:S46 family peptidase [Pyrinomonas methylaliphatogenes]|uniref:Dipeptidyl-peptidase n=1 Tax=Pyrinomonas methylaliphatogenes TaxID=454194 RepID=A0A0B6X1F9_9BACT|nr:S46 family peptidase [Pyrinomonas methylaliphatogenes]MBX5477758.1 S46 family peptidase [Pyrinomonas methylaliphatogenes]CDM66837.1 dipeptidyl-peptidase 7 [Pyrinomonas methylaliphatogenes]